MSTYLVYRIKCSTEGIDKYWTLLDTDPEPTTCPTNTAHTVDTTSIAVIKTVEDNVVKIREESTETGGNFMAESKIISCGTGPNASETHDFVWPIPVSMLGMHTVTIEDNAFDTVDTCVAPNTIIGILTATGATGATGIYVSPTVTANTMVGYSLNLFDGLSVVDCGRVISVDKNNNFVTIENALTKECTVSPTTYIRQTIYVVNDFEFGHAGTYEFGASKIGGSYIPAGVIVRVTYYNEDLIPKNIAVKLEYLY